MQSALGYRPEDLVGFGIADIVVIDELGPVMNVVEESKRQIGVHQAIEVRLRNVDGEFIATRVTTTTFEQGVSMWWALSIRPVDNDDALRARRARLQNIAHETAVRLLGAPLGLSSPGSSPCSRTSACSPTRPRSGCSPSTVSSPCPGRSPDPTSSPRLRSPRNCTVTATPTDPGPGRTPSPWSRSASPEDDRAAVS